MTEKIPLLLLPGLLCDRRVWQPQIEALSDRADIAVPDLTHDDSLNAMARRVLGDAPAQFALAGFSMGGYCAQEIMRLAAGRVTKLALIDTSGRADNNQQYERRRDLIALSEKGEFHGVTDRLLPLLLHPDRLNDKALTRTIEEMAETVGPEAFRRQQTAIMQRKEGRPDLINYNARTVVIVGREDAITPLEHAQEMADLIPPSRLEIIEHCGHMSTLERPEQVNRILQEWLSD